DSQGKGRKFWHSLLRRFHRQLPSSPPPASKAVDSPAPSKFRVALGSTISQLNYSAKTIRKLRALLRLQSSPVLPYPNAKSSEDCKDRERMLNDQPPCPVVSPPIEPEDYISS